MDTLAVRPRKRGEREERRKEVRSVLRVALARASGDLRRACGEEQRECRWEFETKRFILQ